MTKARASLKYLIKLLLAEGLLEFRTFSSEKLVLVAITKDRGNGGIRVGLALLVQHVAPDGQEPKANGVQRILAHSDDSQATTSDQDHNQENDPENCEERLHEG